MYIYDIKKSSKSLVVDTSIHGAPKEAIWLDNERLLFIYGYPGGHFSIGGSVYEYNITTGEKRLVVKSDERQELFDLKKKDGLIEIYSRTHNEEYTRSIVDSFLMDEDYKIIENDPTILTNRDVDLGDNLDDVEKGFIIYDINNDRRLISSMDGYLPAESPTSTFNILLTLIGLEEGVIDLDDNLRIWDGEVREIESWNKDHTLKSAIEDSATWYFSEVAKEIGRERMIWHLDQVGYGYYDEVLKSQSSDIERFWFNGTLSISGVDQVAFITKLYKGELHFKKAHMELVKALIIQEESDSYILAGKTGTTVNWQEENVGWFVGYVKSGGNEYEGEMLFGSIQETYIISKTFANMAFLIFASVMLSRIVVGEYEKQTISVLFSYPINRKKIMVAKLLVVGIFIFMMLMSANIILLTTMVAFNQIFGAAPYVLSLGILAPILINVLVNAFSFTCLGSVCLLFGLKKKSSSATIISGVILSSIISSSSNGLSLSNILLIPIIISVIGIGLTYLSIKNIENVDVL